MDAAAPVHVEYLGFVTRGAVRAYSLRVRRGRLEPEDVTLTIALDAFLRGRVRYQDAAEICFLKVQREVATGAPTPARLEVSDADLEAYRQSHSPNPVRRQKPLLRPENERVPRPE
jgi:hypothetical protein